MLQDPLTLYKLIVLYMLDRVDFPLTQSQIHNFILDKEYTTFLTLQQVLSELTDTRLIHAHTVRNRTYLAITPEGRETLNFFQNRIGDSIKEEIIAYFKEHELALRNEVSVTSEYYKATSGEYEAHLSAKEKAVSLVDITLSVPSEETASAICDNWQQKNQQIYQHLIEQLF